MKAKNIQWDINMSDILDVLDEITAKNAAKALEIPYDTYANMTTEERHDYAYDFFRRYPAAKNELMDLPNDVEIPSTVPQHDIADWLSDSYGFCHDGFELDAN